MSNIDHSALAMIIVSLLAVGGLTSIYFLSRGFFLAVMAENNGED